MYMFISLSAVFVQCQDKCIDVIYLNGADNLVVKNRTDLVSLPICSKKLICLEFRCRHGWNVGSVRLMHT
jgi:hypothetical protein